MLEADLKLRKFDKKRSLDGQLSDLINDIKFLGIKNTDNPKLFNGYGEGVCLILTQLLDKYLINQNFIFKRPKLIEDSYEEIPYEFEEVILEDNSKVLI